MLINCWNRKENIRGPVVVARILFSFLIPTDNELIEKEEKLETQEFANSGFLFSSSFSIVTTAVTGLIGAFFLGAINL